VWGRKLSGVISNSTPKFVAFRTEYFGKLSKCGDIGPQEGQQEEENVIGGVCAEGLFDAENTNAHQLGMFKTQDQNT